MALSTTNETKSVYESWSATMKLNPLPPVDVYESWIGQKVRKTSGQFNQLSPKPFKSGSKTNTVKGVVNHSQLDIPAFTFLEDDSIVECRRCLLLTHPSCRKV